MRVTVATTELRAASQPYERYVQRYVCPIYGVVGSKAESIGSGFLLQLKTETLLCTAAHVLAQAESRTLQVPAGDRIVPIEGDPYISAQRGVKEEARFGLDLGFVVLRRHEMLASPSVPALTTADLDLDDVPATGIAYGFAGVPSSKNPCVGNRFDGSSYFYGGLPAELKSYAKLGYSPASHFIMRFERERMIDESGRVRAVAKPYGMSGGPVFRLGTFNEIRERVASPRVVALAIQWRPAANVLLAVRIALLTDVIKHLLPRLADELPKPSFVECRTTLLS